MFKNNEKAVTIVDVHQDLMSAWNDVKAGHLSTESLKGLNGTASKVIQTAVTHMAFAEKYTGEVDERILRFLAAGDKKVTLGRLKQIASQKRIPKTSAIK